MASSLYIKRLILTLFTLCSISAIAEDIRYQDSVATRNSRVVEEEFKKIHPCPVTNKSEGSCIGWEVDHVIPLACKGKDEVFNLQWLPKAIKSAKGTLPKD